MSGHRQHLVNKETGLPTLLWGCVICAIVAVAVTHIGPWISFYLS